MSKRQAGRQINQLDPDAREDDDEGSEEGSFTPAPAAALAGRKIRALPSRKGPSAPAPAAPKPPAASPFSTGFAGFGTSTPAASNPFAPMPAAVSAPPPTFSFAPVPPPTPQPALDYYMSLRSLNLALLESLSKELEKDPFVDLSGGELGRLEVRYREHRERVLGEFEKATGSNASSNGVQKEDTVMETQSTPTPVPSSSITATTPPITTTPAPTAPALSLPTPPASFTWGGKPVAQTPPPTSTSSSSPAAGGFVFKPDPPATTSKAAPAPAIKFPAFVPPKLINAPSAPSPLRFGESVSPTSTVEKAETESAKEKNGDTPKTQKPFDFGATFGGIAKGEKEGSKKADDTPASVSTPASLPPSTFSFVPTPPSTSSSSTPTIAIPIPFTTPLNPTAKLFSSTSSPPITTTFGTGGSPPIFGFGAALTKTDSAVKAPTSPGFAFGASASGGFNFGSASTGAAKTTGFGFGAAPGSTGFTFGGTAKSEPQKVTTGFSFDAEPQKVTTGFSFGAPSVAPTSVSLAPVPASTSSSLGSSPAPENATSPAEGESEFISSTGNSLVGQGEGEEGETVVFQQRGKVFVLETGADARELGVGNVMIKSSEGEGGKQVVRVLTRNEVNGRVILNFRLTKTFTVKVEKTYLTFVGFEGVDLRMYRVRVKTYEMAADLGKALEKAVAELE